ncbi:MAG: dihydrolipoyl dehydrogenase [Gammaproteobacteria bacterium]|nr:dihydrolipoyl dehydrogenase [Gammaproteobacteria bacterium]
MTRKVDVAIIGSGSAGLNALGQVSRSGKSFLLINGGHWGTTCARVGCMPSKAFIQVAEDFHRRKLFDRHGIVGAEHLELDMDEAMEHVRDLRDIFVDRVRGSSTDNMPEQVLLEGFAEFISPTRLKVGDEEIEANKVVIATGSTPIVPAPWREFGDRVMTTDEIFEQESFPESMAVIGLGVIGLELGQALSRFGVKVTGIDQLHGLGGLSDPVAQKVAFETLNKEFPLWLGEPAQITEGDNGKLLVTAGDKSVQVDKVLVSVGRRPNLAGLKLENLGVALNAAGVPEFDSNTMQIGDLPIFMAGDMTDERPILHEAGDEGKIAGYNASHDEIQAFKRKQTLAITFCDPNITLVGAPWSELEGRDDVVVGEMRMGPVGRALIMGKNKGVIRVYAEKSSGTLLGAELVTAHAEHLGHLLAWSMQQEQTVFDVLRMPFYHPVLEEALQAALNDLRSKVDAPVDAELIAGLALL